MIIAKAGKVILLGVSDENIKRMKEGQPILVDLDARLGTTLGLKIAIIYGATEEKILATIEPLIDEETEIKIDTRFKH